MGQSRLSGTRLCICLHVDQLYDFKVADLSIWDSLQQVATHAIGDRANRIVIDAYRKYSDMQT